MCPHLWVHYIPPFPPSPHQSSCLNILMVFTRDALIMLRQENNRAALYAQGRLTSLNCTNKAALLFSCRRVIRASRAKSVRIFR